MDRKITAEGGEGLLDEPTILMAATSTAGSRAGSQKGDDRKSPQQDPQRKRMRVRLGSNNNTGFRTQNPGDLKPGF